MFLAQFGTGPILPGQHGFARNQLWNVEKKSEEASSIVCTLSQNEKTKRVWPHNFNLVYTISLFKGQLKTSLRVENPSSNMMSFEFNCLLHTYFQIDDVKTVKITGFSGLCYCDKLRNGQLSEETRQSVAIVSEMDRAYLDAISPITLSSANGIITLEKTGFTDYVLWNPWIEKSKTMPDFEDEEVWIVFYSSFVLNKQLTPL